jgi:hypothetical protein
VSAFSTGPAFGGPLPKLVADGLFLGRFNQLGCFNLGRVREF